MNFFYETHENEIMFSERSVLAFQPHLHMQAEIAFILDGSTTCSIDGEEFRLQKGDTVIIYPNKIHSYYEDSRLTSLLLILDPADFPELKSMFQGQEPMYPVLHKEQLESIHFFKTLHFAFQEFHFESDAVKKASVLLVLGKLFSLLDFKQKNSGDSGILREILSFCEEHYKESITLSDTAAALHISNGYLSHIFSGRLRMSFTDYINMLRIKDACILLKSSDASITEISNMSGYTSLRTFNRAFLKHIGMAPREYRNL